MAHSSSGKGRTDIASRIVKAPPSIVYRAFVDPQAWLDWLPPKGMVGHIHTFDAREGGTYRLTLTYADSDDPVAYGKTTDNTDVVQGTFVALEQDRRIVQQVEFESEDAAFAGTMKMSWTLTVVPEGTEVVIVCDNVPEGIRREDHEDGLNSTLDNLAAYVE